MARKTRSNKRASKSVAKKSGSATAGREELETQLLEKIIAEKILVLKILSKKAAQLESGAKGVAKKVRPAAFKSSNRAAKARVVVYRVLRESFGDLAITDATKLSSLGFDTLSLAGLAGAIWNQGVPVDTAAIQRCATVGDVVAATAQFM